MEYNEALKKVQSKKPKDNFMVVTLSYNCKLLLPYKDGLLFMSALANAEQLGDEYGKPKRILPLERESLSSHLMSADEYETYKIAALLNVSPEEVKEFALKASS